MLQGKKRKRKERKRRKERKMKNTSIDTGVLVMVMGVMMGMIFSPECGRGCHPMGARVRGHGVCKK